MIISIEEKPELKPISMWKRLLLFFCPTHLGFDTEGDIVSVCFAKKLFKQLFVMRIDYFSVTTGNLLKTRKLIRSGYVRRNY